MNGQNRYVRFAKLLGALLAIIIAGALGWSWYHYGNLTFSDSLKTEIIGDAPWCVVEPPERILDCRYYSEIHCLRWGLADDNETFCVRNPRMHQ